ncbi:hypothetical protein LV457_16760 [Mycobacterium sp. MYCO198283]|uniref:hypothetical protein n=1 Tax=Mycobacterium sp. MYCO198283 TaxID=2883505 RepID=UPI001E4F9481|nr:hypothetical protein [Mycobacterium sp. MYCO198283]MCG5433929.1 hypothetical protein [Mycobacterium sp. MYCO198283]
MFSTVSGAVLLVWVSSPAILETERDYPVTATGRIIAVSLIGGISLLGTIAFWIGSG